MSKTTRSESFEEVLARDASVRKSARREEEEEKEKDADADADNEDEEDEEDLLFTISFEKKHKAMKYQEKKLQAANPGRTTEKMEDGKLLKIIKILKN